jgi:hypothetical protein
MGIKAFTGQLMVQVGVAVNTAVGARIISTNVPALDTITSLPSGDYLRLLRSVWEELVEEFTVHTLGRPHSPYGKGLITAGI